MGKHWDAGLGSDPISVSLWGFWAISSAVLNYQEPSGSEWSVAWDQGLRYLLAQPGVMGGL